MQSGTGTLSILGAVLIVLVFVLRAVLPRGLFIGMGSHFFRLNSDCILALSSRGACHRHDTDCQGGGERSGHSLRGSKARLQLIPLDLANSLRTPLRAGRTELRRFRLGFTAAERWSQGSWGLRRGAFPLSAPE